MSRHKNGGECKDVVHMLCNTNSAHSKKAIASVSQIRDYDIRSPGERGKRHLVDVDGGSREHARNPPRGENVRGDISAVNNSDTGKERSLRVS